MSGNDDYRDELRIGAPIGAVYEALTTPDGIRGWWAANADVGTQAGGVMHLRWSETDWTELRVDRLERPSAVEWTCTGCHVSAFDPPDEWVGTRMSFGLSEADGGTRIELVHRGLKPLACVDICERGWTHHLHTSLRSLLEEGQGQPVR